MRLLPFALVTLLLPFGVLAQSVPPRSSGATAAPPRLTERDMLPVPNLPPDAPPADFLRAARGAVVAGRLGEARQSLEMAATRLLSRVVDAGKERDPADDRAIRQISGALAALTANDRTGCVRYIEFASQSIGAPLN